MNSINSNLINNLYPNGLAPDLKLTQIDGWEPVPEFVDSDGQRWKLIKSASSGMGEIPDPQSVNIIDYWNHVHPGSNNKIFIYVVEGVRVPKTARETACRVLYSWFSTVDNKGFTPQMIKPNEWLTANVYASTISDARVSKLKSLCKISDGDKQPTPQETGTGFPPPTPLINMEMLQNDTGTKQNVGESAADSQRERGRNHK